jgi:hypothetical protein
MNILSASGCAIQYLLFVELFHDILQYTQFDVVELNDKLKTTFCIVFQLFVIFTYTLLSSVGMLEIVYFTPSFFLYTIFIIGIAVFKEFKKSDYNQ